jgi:sulfite reductase (NADPH) flavoprotein alpha-component
MQPAATVLLERDSLHTLQNAVAGYDREQLLWSSGYLAGMAAVRVAEQLPAATQTVAVVAPSAWLIFYATETGNSRRVAESLAERSREAGLAVELHDLRDYRPKTLSKVENALFVVATHGIGEAPDGSEMFFEYWFSDKAPRLEQLNYSILALGDSSYADFCEMGKMLDTRLQELGARAVVERVDCDLDFDAHAANWGDKVVKHAVDHLEADLTVRTPYLRPVSQVTLFTRERPFNAEVLTNHKITGDGSSKDVRHIELNLQGSGLNYLPGDSLGVVPQNPPELVEAVLDSVRLDGAEQVVIDGKSIALSEVLTQHKEITVLNRPFLEAVAPEHENLQRIVADRDKLAEYFNTRQLIDVIGDYRKRWQAQEFVDALRKLTPRLYSIASSLDANPDEAHLTVAVVRYEQFGRSHWGSASNFLIGGAESVPVYVEPNDHFRLPAEGDTPVIMIGAGTGVAPYRAFVEHRREHGQRGDNWLVFGDRNLSTDFLYQIEWLRYRKDGTLKCLDVAFSRDQQDKIYVQQRILEQAKRVYSWLERGAHIYVCGDAARMAGDVNEALLAVLCNEGGLSEERAAEYLGELKSAHRYQRDVY